jgi:putative methionine-R-sulfoxide reductase with GAF domain
VFRCAFTGSGGTFQLTQQISSTPERPVLDEGTFQQLLAAAYVLQEHNEHLSTPDARTNYAQILLTIIETQKLIQTQHLDLSAAAALIAERVQKITHATGVTVGIVEGDQLAYRAATGSAAGESRSRVSVNSCLAADCLRSGQILQSFDVIKDSRLRAELCRDLGISSLIAVPVYHEGRVAGVLELHFAQANSFQEHDVRAAQLMAGLVTEAIAHAAELRWKQTLAAERAAMFDALDKLKPQLERLVVEGQRTASAPATAPVPPAAAFVEKSAVPSAPAALPAAPPIPAGEPQTEESTGAICRGCGHEFGEDEFFCGICGTARMDKTPSGDIRSKWSSLWHLQHAAEKREAKKKFVTAPEVKADENGTMAPLPPALEAMVARFAAEANSIAEAEKNLAVQAEASSTLTRVEPSATRVEEDPTAGIEAETAETDSIPETEAALRIIPAEVSALPAVSAPPAIVPRSPWTSAARARAWLESLKAQQGPRRTWLTRQWHRHRANVYLGGAALILLLVLSGWGTKSAQSGNSVAPANTAANARRRRVPAKPNLTLFEQLLVSLGIAEAPPAPVYLGNPNTQVWVDLQHALYYCPGAELYGKTPAGKYTSQRDAQQDQFEPASRQACD